MKLKPFYLSKLRLPFIKFIKTTESIIFILMKYFLYKSINIYFLVNKPFKKKYLLCMKLKPFYLSKLQLPFIKFINTMESIIFYTHEIFPL